MPQLSPMSWIMVISMFLVCLVFFAVTMWWLIDGKYIVKNFSNKNITIFNKKFMKWGFGSSLSK
uniref:ATP synthase F0 subunit 8 n=1 Tax=Anodonta anatina TaxID=143294 RepID=U5KJM0_ANOAN|nr:ATP synthase F0 subunit 8 [Anodonta anatina]AGS17950.1 ATP synthase F0 subunit 8 [Anodonta anatina]AGS17992.1 ATP synthase F0 subunit 8 [Anodonta anatina]AGS18006.1 ATP synthase F0 subunit 8 [Anodonta anatina]